MKELSFIAMMDNGDRRLGLIGEKLKLWVFHLREDRAKIADSDWTAEGLRN